MVCDQCGARRPRSGPCPDCGAPAPGTYSSMRQWRDTARSGEGPAVGGGRPGAGGGAGSGAGWRNAPPGRSGAQWDEGGWDDAPQAPSRSNSRTPGPRRPQPNYEEVDLERALVPARNDMLPMDPMMGGMGGGMGLAAPLPGMPTTDEEERALGIRRPVYIPATGEKRKRKLGSWRVISGILSVMLVCVASCGLTGVLARTQIASLFAHPRAATIKALTFSTANVPVTPVATPGAQAKYASQVVTSSGLDAQQNPVNPRTHFLVDDTVYVTMIVRGLPAGKHTIAVRWFLADTYIQLPLSTQTSVTVDKDQRVFFALKIPTPGVGTARIYIDRPNSDVGDAATDPTLAATIYFAVEMPTPVPTVAPKTPITTPGTKTPVATGTPKTSVGSVPTA